MSSVQRHLSQSYTPDESDKFWQFDFYHITPTTSVEPLLIFVHGGAWRSEDKADHGEMASKLCSETSCSVAVPNYRLTSKDTNVRHPDHALDILKFLQFALRGDNPFFTMYDASQLYLIGHSCGAHMISSILLDSSAVTPSLDPPSEVLNAIQGVVTSEGIYSLESLVETFPTYRKWFIEETFGLEFDNYSATRLMKRPSQKYAIR